MDRVTRYPIFSIPHSTRITSLVLDGDVSYPVQLVSVGPEVTGWDHEESPIRSNDHKVQPDTARTGMSHRLQAFSQQLYPEDRKDVKADHTGDARDTVSKQQWDLERERRQVIQGQRVKKSGTVAMLQGAAGQGDEVPGPALTESLEENSVDRKQVDFWAARQQFLNLEQANAGLSRESMSRRVPVSVPPVVNQTPKTFSGPHVANGYGTPIEAQMKKAVEESKKAQGSPVESHVRTTEEPGPRPQSESPEPTKETPIEREIRLAQEREGDLREQRGLQRVAGHQELVQITTRPLLTKVSLTSAPRWERGRPSLYVQRDLEQETLREQDHRQQWGRAPTPDWASKSPQRGLRRVLSCDSILDRAPDARAAEPVPEVRRINRIPPDAYQPYLNPGSPSLESPASRASTKSWGPSADTASPKTTGSQRRVWEPSETSSGTREVPLKPPRGSPRADLAVVKRDQFLLRPLRFRVRDGPQQAEAPQGWGWAGDGGTPALRLHKSPSSELLEREMESVLRREREVAEERRVALFPEVFSPPPRPDEGSDQDSRSSSRASGITGSYSVSESPLFTPIQLHSGLVWRVESEPQSPEDSPEEAPWPRRKKELGYAGIDPSDHINSEVLEATRVTRHKSTMAERWEARIYASEDED